MGALGKEIAEAVAKVLDYPLGGMPATFAHVAAAADAAIAPLVGALSMAIVFLDRDKLPPEVVAKIRAAFASVENDK